MGAPGGDGDERPLVGRSYKERPLVTETYEGGFSSEGYDFEARNVEDAYADHLLDYGVGGYPGGPWSRKDPEGKQLLADNPVNPDAVQRRQFVDVGTYMDPDTGKPRPSSPIEQLREDLDRLKGKGEGQGLKVLLTLSALKDQDLGAWQAANDLWVTTERAKTTVDGAIQRVFTVYEAVVQALDDTVKTATGADKSSADNLRTPR
ncbi:hypothetical protein ACFOY2_02390 [Nonomuraea purpurea]|uniref:Uncharacterized protein n=1 Tax=Nonomuraea purpurea TaxID=1849276 RepID=A0ABV8FZJ5_9ACTN